MTDIEVGSLENILLRPARCRSIPEAALSRPGRIECAVVTGGLSRIARKGEEGCRVHAWDVIYVTPAYGLSKEPRVVMTEAQRTRNRW